MQFQENKLTKDETYLALFLLLYFLILVFLGPFSTLLYVCILFNYIFLLNHSMFRETCLKQEVVGMSEMTTAWIFYEDTPH